MRCEEVTEYMQRSLDNDLTPTETAEMEEHLHSCEECSVMYQTLKQLHEELENLPDVEPPMSIVDSILPQLSLAGQSQLVNMPTSLPKVKKNWARKPWSFVAGGVAAAILLALLAPQFFGESEMKMTEMSDGPAEMQPTQSLAVPLEESKEELSTMDAAKVEVPSVANDVETLTQKQVETPMAMEPTEPAEPQGQDQVMSQQVANSTAVQPPKEEPTRNNEPQPKPEEPVAPAESEVAMAPPVNPPEEVHSLAAKEPVVEENLMMSMTSEPVQPDSFGSPDGMWNARVDGQRIVILDQDGVEVFRSHEWTGAAYVSVEWVDAAKVMYTLYPVNAGTEEAAAKPLEKWLINVKQGQEQKQ
ncbi:zf-HC2 domain-containing protein [Ammoniphilus sp. CFH 90114]|uniref:zf-HC2 domain-containing protein n=1 Tax=Ammoniphilus sp. CFH 90114 TaxID=2493665 RepID=UPI00100FA854|nr:zf-HC2 domain-containing protein [Ammoniphilus sp. CFH 90114]RXT14804.1 hypothetical protein EIZ39_00910 [Ammoniphilus sp. CFH 90114]